VRTLCLLSKAPLPPDNGSRQRLVHLLQALASLGPVDLAFDRPMPEADLDAARAAFPGARVWAPDVVPRHRSGRLRWLTHRKLPLRPALIDPAPVRRDFAAFVARTTEPYDLVWSHTTTPSWLLGPVVRPIPLIIDFPDVQRTIQSRPLEAARRAPDRWTLAGMKKRVRLRTERDRWTRFERHEGSRANVVTVCSAPDREAQGIPGAIVVPNGYAKPEHPVGRLDVSDEPLIVLAGQLTYGPNVDGATWFVNDIFPLVRERVPGARLALVGRASSDVEALGGVAGVDVRGYADVIEDELARADVVVVPLRDGSGTRIKILEAWAHHLPVVSTSIGAEGLDAESDRDLVLADDAHAFAKGVERVITDASMRRSLTDQGARRFEREFDWRVIEAHFAERARDVVVGATRFDRAGPA
jgi:glycosyltransferase involved in cell wall biosynthesis